MWSAARPWMPSSPSLRADMLARKLLKRAWQKLSAGAGAKGHRFYDWAVIDLTDPRPGSRQLLIRRNFPAPVVTSCEQATART